MSQNNFNDNFPANAAANEEGEKQSSYSLNGCALAAWEIASVTTSFLIAEWTILPFVGNNKLIGAIPVALAFALMILSHKARGESLRELGFRFDNFFQAMRLLALPMIVATILIVLIGWLTGGLRFDPALLRTRFLLLPVWAFFQQYVIQSFINRRAQIVWGRGAASVLVVAFLFALFHFPNPWLSLATFVGGVLWATIYQRVPNLFALAISHSLMSLLLALTLPPSILNSLRVGFKYFGYN
jgi:membrane protease YdiL (CAAX protease family)